MHINLLMWTSDHVETVGSVDSVESVETVETVDSVGSVGGRADKSALGTIMHSNEMTW
jgi:hypothetical protein